MAYDKDNIFAKIIRKEIPSAKVYEDDDVYAFHDIAKAAPVHVLVVPKGEYESFDDFVKKANMDVIANFFIKVQKIAEMMKVTENGYRIITNHGLHASQSVPHFHVHIIGGRALGALLPGDIHSR
jgi:diadenosine tetraphosphate (Ap4A) HIT family hydrolase